MIPKCNQAPADAPRFAYRGVMLDCCRHFWSVAQIKKLLDQMAVLKLNVFHWHLSNDQGFRIESKLFPELNTISSWRKLDECDPIVWKDSAKLGQVYGGYYTQAEIREIVAYAKERFIDVIPEIELPGHSTAILAAHPELSCTGEPMDVASSFGVWDRIFCPGKEETYQFLFALLEEIIPLFDSRYFHIGGDEAPKSAWKSCPHCRAVMEKEGYTNYEQLQVHFTNRIIAFLKERGKTPIVWNESATVDGLDEAAVIQYWMEMAPGPSYIPKEFPKGRKVIFSNQCQFYADYSYAETPLRATLNFEPNVKGTPVPEENVLGIECPLWTEWLAEDADMEKMLWPRLLAVAECGWTRERNTEDFLRRAKQFLNWPQSNFLTPMPWEEATISGEAALNMIAEKMLELSARHGAMAAKRGSTAGAVVPEDSAQMDPAIMAYLYMKSKMEAAYSEEEIKQTLRILSEMRK